MAVLTPAIFDKQHKSIIRDFVVKKILVVDRVSLLFVKITSYYILNKYKNTNKFFIRM